VAGNFEEYGGIAVALATDLQRLAGTRAGLRAEMRRSALTDERAFAREMEKVLREMWRMYCAGTSTALSS
jgi:predicted O-linked N-acetylglucosamine transferase (SPINDLY family)